VDDPDRICDIGRLARQIENRAQDSSRGVLVGIDGPGASGKSTLANQLAQSLENAAVVQGDDFYLPSGVRPRADAAVGAQFDLDRLLRQVVAPAAAGMEVRYQRYDWDRDALATWISIPPGSTIIVEGIYATEQRLRDHYTFRIFCLADRQLRLRRGLDRDGEGARTQWTDEWMPAEDHYIATQRPDLAAQLVLDGGGRDQEQPVYSVVAAGACGAGLDG
jgi:uridine kinase